MASLSDLYKQAQKGDNSAFYTWAESIQPEIGRFAYQLGITIEKLQAFQQFSFQQLRKQIDDLTAEDAKIRLYKLAIQQATTCLPIELKENRQVLGFKEDQELHDELQKLELNQRASLALFYFQEVSISDIMAITEKSEQDLMESKKQGLQELQSHLKMGEAQVVKRLAMLEKSYKRFVPPSPMEQEVQEHKEKFVEAESTPLITPSPRVQKKTAVVLAVAGLFLAAVIGVSFSVNDQQAQTAGTTEFQQEEKVTEEMVADWRGQYEAIKETSPERLGMSREQYSGLEYVKLADAEMERIFSEESLESLEEDPVKMQAEVHRLFRQIETPRGMVDSLSDLDPMPAAESETFLRNYAAKTDELRVFTDSVLLEYRQELEATIVMDQLSPEKLLAQTDSFPEELRLVVEALPEFNLMPVVHPNDNRFRAVRDVSALTQQQPLASGPYAWQYLSFLSTEPYFDSSGFLMPLNSIPQQLITMEQALLEEGEATVLFGGMEVAYLQTFWQLIKGSGNAPVFDEAGKVKTEYRNAWYGVASSNSMAYLMLPILKEMEESGWTASVHYDDLQFDDLSETLELEKSGQLADKLPNGNLVIEDEFVDMQDFDYSRIQPLYESFKVTHDMQLLAGVPPLDVMFMYHYANKMDDTETLWHLLADSPIKPALEVFQEEWQPVPELTENANWVELSEDFYKQRVKDKIYIYPQVGSDEIFERLDVLLVTEKDQIWQIDYQQYDSYDLLGEDQSFKEKVDALYASISDGSQNQLPIETKGGEVAGIFFKAIENKDMAAMRKLTTKTDWTDDELQYFVDLQSFPPFSEMEQLTFRTHFSTDTAAALRGNADIKYASESQESLIQEMFLMEKTVDGWRMANLNDY